MKNFKTIAAVLFLTVTIIFVSCGHSTNNVEQNSVIVRTPKSTPIAVTTHGVLSKFVDGENTIYIYERASTAAVPGSISVVKNTSCK